MLRALWPALLGERDELLTAAYALDSVLLEIAFVVGPIFVAGVAAVASPQLALVASVVFVTAGTLLFTATPMARAFAPAEDHAHDTGGRLGALRSPGVRTLVMSTVPIGFCIGAAEVSFPAFGEYVGSRALAGPLLALWSLGSAIGGLIYGAYGHRIPISSAYLRTAALLPIVTLPLALPSTFAGMVPLAMLAGLAIAPLLSAGNQLIGEVAPRGAVTEAFTWPLTALVAGVAGGNAVAGAIVAVPRLARRIRRRRGRGGAGRGRGDAAARDVAASAGVGSAGRVAGFKRSCWAQLQARARSSGSSAGPCWARSWGAGRASGAEAFAAPVTAAPSRPRDVTAATASPPQPASALCRVRIPRRSVRLPSPTPAGAGRRRTRPGCGARRGGG